MQRTDVSAEKRRAMLSTTAFYVVVGNAVLALGCGECSHSVLFYLNFALETKEGRTTAKYSICSISSIE